MKLEVLLTEKLKRAMDESFIANKRLKEKLDALFRASKQDLLTVTGKLLTVTDKLLCLKKQIELVTMERDENRFLYNYTRYIIYCRC